MDEVLILMRPILWRLGTVRVEPLDAGEAVVHVLQASLVLSSSLGRQSVNLLLGVQIHSVFPSR